jgi:GntR family frlABCD operon transcriptional regulator
MDFHDNRPLYQQVEASIRNKIREKVYLPGEQLPTEDELCEIYGVSKITIRKAFKLLTENGLVERLRGKGTFVSQKKESLKLSGVYGFTNALSNRGHTIRYTVLHSKIIKASTFLANKLKIKENDKVCNIKRLMWEDGAPIGIDDFYASEEKYPTLFKKGSQNTSLYKLLEEDYAVEAVNSTIEIKGLTASPELAELLQCITEDPLFVLEKVGRDKYQNPIHFSISTVRCDRISYVIEITNEVKINSKDQQTNELHNI